MRSRRSPAGGGALGSAVMGKGARSGRRSRASGGGGGGRWSKRPRRVAEEEQEEEEVEPVEGEEEAEAEAEAVEGEDYCFVCKDGGDLRVCDFRFAPLSLLPGPLLPSSLIQQAAARRGEEKCWLVLAALRVACEPE